VIGFGGIHRDREADALRLHTWLPGRRLPLADLLIILLFAAYPAAFAALSLAFLRTFHLVLAGMVRRGAAFVFRTYRTHIGGAPRTWGCEFAIASTLPGAPGDHAWCDRDRGLRVVDGVVQPFPLALGALTLRLSMYS